MSDNSKIIFIVNGFYRTGSTLVYIIIQKIMEYSKIEYVYAGENKNQIDEIIKNPQSNYVIKTHDWMPQGNYENVKILYTIRNPLDYVASKAIRAAYEERIKVDSNNIPILDDNWKKHILTKVKEQIENQKKLVNRKDTLILEYESLYYNIRDNIKKISEFINIPANELINEIEYDVSMPEIKKQIEKIPQQGADPKTQLRHGQISEYNGKSGYWYKILPLDLITNILNILKQEK